MPGDPTALDDGVMVGERDQALDRFIDNQNTLAGALEGAQAAVGKIWRPSGTSVAIVGDSGGSRTILRLEISDLTPTVVIYIMPV